MSFPRILHRINLDAGDLPENENENLVSWKTDNPSFDYMLWDDEKIQEILTTGFPWFLETYNSFQTTKKKEDVAILAILYKYGGISVNKNLISTAKIEPVLKKYDNSKKQVIISKFENNGHLKNILNGNLNFNREMINNNLQIAKPNSACIKAALKNIEQKQKKIKKKCMKSEPDVNAIVSNVYNYDDYKYDIEIIPYDNLFTTFESNEKSKSKSKKSKVFGIAIFIFLIISIYLVSSRFLGKTFAGLALLSIVTVCIIIIVTSTHGAYVSDKEKTSDKPAEPLDDRGHDLIPVMENKFGKWFFFEVPALIFIGLLLFLFFKDFRMFIVFLISWLIFFNLREFTIQLTALPSPQSDVGTKWGFIDAFQESFKTRDSEIHGDTDMIFSGHTGTTSLTILFFMLYTGLIEKWYGKLLYFVIMIFFIYGILSIRIHYSVDTALAFIISLLIFGYAYNFYKNRKKKFLKGSFLFNLLILSLFLSLFSTVLNLSSGNKSVLNI